MPFVLNVSVELFRPRVHGGIQSGVIGIAAEVRLVTLLDPGGNACHLYNRLLQPANVQRRDATGRCSRRRAKSRDIVETALPRGLIEEDDGGQNAAAEKSAAIVVGIETEIHSRADSMRSMNIAHVINELRGRDRARGVRRNAIRSSNVNEGTEDAVVAPRRQLAGSEIRVGFAEGESEREAVEPGNRLVYKRR